MNNENNKGKFLRVLKQIAAILAVVVLVLVACYSYLRFPAGVQFYGMVPLLFCIGALGAHKISQTAFFGRFLDRILWPIRCLTAFACCALFAFTFVNVEELMQLTVCLSSFALPFFWYYVFFDPHKGSEDERVPNDWTSMFCVLLGLAIGISLWQEVVLQGHPEMLLFWIVFSIAVCVYLVIPTLHFFVASYRSKRLFACIMWWSVLMGNWIGYGWFPFYRRIDDLLCPRRLPRFPSRRSFFWRKRGGVTLIEMLIVVAIISIIVVSWCTSVSQNARHTQFMQSRRVAAVVAEEQVDLLRMRGVLPPVGQYAMDESLATRHGRYLPEFTRAQYEIRSVADERLREVVVTIPIVAASGDMQTTTIMSALLPSREVQ